MPPRVQNLGVFSVSPRAGSIRSLRGGAKGGVSRGRVQRVPLDTLSRREAPSLGGGLNPEGQLLSTLWVHRAPATRLLDAEAAARPVAFAVEARQRIDARFGAAVELVRNLPMEQMHTATPAIRAFQDEMRSLHLAWRGHLSSVTGESWALVERMQSSWRQAAATGPLFDFLLESASEGDHAGANEIVDMFVAGANKLYRSSDNIEFIATKSSFELARGVIDTMASGSLAAVVDGREIHFHMDPSATPKPVGHVHVALPPHHHEDPFYGHLLTYLGWGVELYGHEDDPVAVLHT